MVIELAAASTFYVSPSGELIFYATEHDNDGPDATVKVGEWRHVDTVRPNSPTLLPSAKLDGPFVVDEGSAINLTGIGQPPVTRAFLEMFTYPDPSSYWVYLTADYKDRNRDDFDDLFTYEYKPPINHANTGFAWAWFAPKGQSVSWGGS